MNTKRVVITGLGALTPIGNNIEEYWEALINGVSGAAPITHFDASNFKTQFARGYKYSKDAKQIDQTLACFIAREKNTNSL